MWRLNAGGFRPGTRCAFTHSVSSPHTQRARFLRTRDIWLLSPRHDVKRQKPTLFYRKRLCVIHFELLRGPVCFSPGRRNGQVVCCYSVVCLDLLDTFNSRYCRTVTEGFRTSGFTWKSCGYLYQGWIKRRRWLYRCSTRCACGWR